MDETPQGNGRWIFGSTAAVLALVALAFTLGFLVVPIIQGRDAGIDPWTAFCRAVGILPGVPPMAQPQSSAIAQPVSKVSWDAAVIDALGSGDPRAGATLAQERCAACHGDRGLSPSDQYPHLSGQSAAAIYKQLHDYQSGARSHQLMTGIVQDLSEQQMLDVSAYYAGRNSFRSLGRAQPLPDYEMDRLANRGAPDRNIPACNACHSAGAGGPIETPTLVGQHRDYLERQLRLYASGERRNDVFGRMRTIAARLTRDEIATLSLYYSGMSPDLEEYPWLSAR